MKTTVTESTFINTFADYGRGEQFSYNGRAALYNYLTEFEEGTGTEIEFDCVALCCDFSEYNDAEQAVRYYTTDDEFAEEFADVLDDDLKEACKEYLEENTIVIEFEGGIIIRAF